MGRKRVKIAKLKGKEREDLNQYLRKGKSSARSQTCARLLLLSDEGREDDTIVDTLKVSKSTVS